MKPLLKWVGGKQNLSKKIAGIISDRCTGTYVEPFAGAASVFFRIKDTHRFSKYIISDVNCELMRVYNYMVRHYDKLRDILLTMIDRYNSGDDRNRELMYQCARVEYGATDNQLMQVVLFIFLNRTAFNGLYRVNKNNGFNVPFGKYKKIALSSDLLDAIHRSLSTHVSMQNQGRTWTQVIDDLMFMAQKLNYTKFDSIWIYFDPPYYPVKKTSFVGYNPHPFTVEDHSVLARVCAVLADKGVNVVVTNSDTEEVRELYKGFGIERVIVDRNVSGDGGYRRKVGDLIITNKHNKK